MKNALPFFLILALGLPSTSSSAELTFKAGLNQSKLAAISKGSWATGFSVGAAVSLRLFRNGCLQPEFFFTRKGDGRGFPLAVPGMSSKITLDYLEMPLALKWRFLPGKKIRLAVLGGGYAALNVGAKCRSEFQGGEFLEDLKDDVRKPDYGLIFGVEIEKALGTKRLSLDVRGSRGLGKVNAFTSAQAWRNTGLTVLLGFGF